MGTAQLTHDLLCKIWRELCKEPPVCCPAFCDVSGASVVTLVELVAKSADIGDGYIHSIDVDNQSDSVANIDVSMGGNTTSVKPSGSRYIAGDEETRGSLPDDFTITIPAGATAVISWTYVKA